MPDLATCLEYGGVSGQRVDLVWVEVGEDIPVRFRTYVPPLGVVYARFGSGGKGLCEVLVERETGTVRGLTLVAIDKRHQLPVAGGPELPVSRGLPLVGLDSLEVLRRDFSRDVGSNMSVCVSGGSVEIVFCQNAKPTSIVGLPNVEFLVQDDCIVGARIGGLTARQLQLFL